MTTIITKNSSTAGAAPLAADLVQGELAVNVTSKALYTKNASAAVVKLNTPSIVDNGDATAITIDSSENVGIGTNSPVSKLHVYGSGQIGVIESSGNYATSGAGYVRWKDVNGNAAFVGFAGNANNFDIYNSLAGALTFSTNATERARIDSSGNLLVGTTTASAKNYTVQSANSNGLGVETTGSGFTSNAFQTGVYGTVAGSGFNHIACKNSSAANIFAVRGDGFIYTPNLGAATGTAVVLNANGFLYTLSSSGRYKKDVTPIDIGLDFILGLNPVKYNLIETNEPQVGFIAEDFPDSRLVSMSKVDKQDDSKGLQAESVNYAQIVAPLVKAIQEQQALINAQQAALTTLTERITALEAK